MAETNWLSTAAKTHAPTVGAIVSIDPTISLTHVWTPAQNETVNAVSPGMPQQMLTLVFKTSGVTSYNITMGTNFAAANIIPTGTTSGAFVTALFMSTGSSWVLIAGSSTLASGSSIGSGSVITAPSSASTGIMLTSMVTFTENATNTIHTGTVTLPAGSWLHSIRVTSAAKWTGGTASMDVGDTGDPDGYFSTIDLKGTDLEVGEILDTTSSTLWGGQEGAYLVAASGRRGPTTANFGQYYAAGSDIVGVVTVGTPATTVGRTYMEVIYSIGANVAAVATGP